VDRDTKKKGSEEVKINKLDKINIFKREKKEFL
jgi:hypothetical protein